MATKTRRGVVTRSQRPNTGIEREYKRRLEALVDEMDRSLVYWIKAAWRVAPPHAPMAQDVDPAGALRILLRRLGRQWQKRFDDAAPKLAEWFARRSMGTADRGYMGILNEAGFTVKFTMSPVIRQAYQAVIGENVSLIKSIASDHLSDVEQSVMRSVAAGRDLASLSTDLQERFGMTKRRAAFIALDQNNKATATIVKTRQQELGITKARWKHSHAGKHPRPSHVAADGKLYDVAKGMLLDGVWTHPGQEIGCRCTSESVIPGLEHLI